MSFVTIEEALERIAGGEMLVVVDSPDRENEGDLTMVAEHVTAEDVNFMIREARGLLCMPCDADRLDDLRVGPMVPADDSGCDTAFTVSIDHRLTGTGISAYDRALTIRSIPDPGTRPWDLRRPGHVFPLRARPGGVLERQGHTEAAVDLARLAGLAPCAAICEVLSGDGRSARVPELQDFARHHGVAVVSIDEIVAYRMAYEGRSAAR